MHVHGSTITEQQLGAAGGGGASKANLPALYTDFTFIHPYTINRPYAVTSFDCKKCVGIRKGVAINPKLFLRK